MPQELRKTSKKPPTPLGRNFHRFWIGSLSSNLADGVMLVALPMVAAMLTNDPLLVSGLMVARFLPWLLFGLFAGTLVDRWDRGTVLIVSNLVRACVLVVLAALVATGNANIWALYAVMFVVMVCEVFYDLAGRAILPALVPSGTIDRANGRLVGGKTATEDFAGSPLAGFLFAVAAALPLVVNAGAYLLGALVLLGLPLAVRRPPRDEQKADEGTPRTSLLTEMREGLSYLFAQRTLLPMLCFNIVTNMAFIAQAGILVLIVQDHFGVPEALYGVFLTSAAGGAVVGAVLVNTLVAKLGRFATEIICFGLMGVCCLAFGLAPNAWLAALAWGTLAVATTVSNTVMIGAIQLIVPNTMLGRFMSIVQMTGAGLAPVGAFLGGLLGRIELYYVPLVAGTVVLLALLPTIPALRRMTRRADEVEREAVQERPSA